MSFVTVFPLGLLNCWVYSNRKPVGIINLIIYIPKNYIIIPFIAPKSAQMSSFFSVAFHFWNRLTRGCDGDYKAEKNINLFSIQRLKKDLESRIRFHFFIRIKCCLKVEKLIQNILNCWEPTKKNVSVFLLVEMFLENKVCFKFSVGKRSSRGREGGRGRVVTKQMFRSFTK